MLAIEKRRYEYMTNKQRIKFTRVILDIEHILSRLKHLELIAQQTQNYILELEKELNKDRV